MLVILAVVTVVAVVAVAATKHYKLSFVKLWKWKIQTD